MRIPRWPPLPSWEHIPPWEKEHNLQTYLGWGYVSLEGNHHHRYLLWLHPSLTGESGTHLQGRSHSITSDGSSLPWGRRLGPGGWFEVSEPGNYTENQRLETENGLVEDGDSKMKSIIFRFYVDFRGCNISCAKRHFLSWWFFIFTKVGYVTFWRVFNLLFAFKCCVALKLDVCLDVILVIVHVQVNWIWKVWENGFSNESMYSAQSDLWISHWNCSANCEVGRPI